VPAAAAAGNAVTEGGSTAAQGGYLGDIDKVYGALETDGFEAEGWVAGMGLRGKLRGARDTLGQKVDANRVSSDLKSIDGLPISYPMRGLWPTSGGAGTNVRAIVGDFDEFVVGVRQDITLKVLTEAVIQDNTGAIIYNLAQQDMTALRLTFRVGWQVANTINNDQPVEANRYPAATLVF
jgi:HK97 family phage major capsid protein